ncbi:PIN domain-containing protein [Paenarthrobacter sp. RAF54_2]|uniref:PIN domain-containing protein n=1 Tax=Paenarthrobacter sp. RAF54_2 TaxID=3233061 RepID=UPI003F97703D
MISIVVDTNILYDTPLLDRAEWISLTGHQKDWQVEVLVPEVVQMETVTVVTRKWSDQQSTLDKLRVAELGLQKEQQSLSQNIQDRIDGYEEVLVARMAELGIEAAPTPAVGHLEVAERASKEIAPYTKGRKDGYRDTLIWLTVLDVATREPDHEVWFVSNNDQDFGDPSASMKKNDLGADVPQLPRPLHPHLLEELVNRGLAGRVKYATSLRALEAHIAALHGAIPAHDLRDLVAAINLEALEGLLTDQASMRWDHSGFKVSAKAAALNPRYSHCLVNWVRPRSRAWGFSDAAGRGNDRWTANFSVEVDANIVAVDGDPTELMTSSFIEKPLLATGTVTLTKQGEPVEVQVSRLEALPDDPDRGLWALIEAAGFPMFDSAWPTEPSLGWPTEASRYKAIRSAAVHGLGRLSDQASRALGDISRLPAQDAKNIADAAKLANGASLSAEAIKMINQAANTARGLNRSQD